MRAEENEEKGKCVIDEEKGKCVPDTELLRVVRIPSANILIDSKISEYCDSFLDNVSTEYTQRSNDLDICVLEPGGMTKLTWCPGFIDSKYASPMISMLPNNLGSLIEYTDGVNARSYIIMALLECIRTTMMPDSVHMIDDSVNGCKVLFQLSLDTSK